MLRNLLLYLFIMLTFYCYGAGMMDYFAIYEAWKMIDTDLFTDFHRFQGDRVIAIFVIPSAVMTILNVLVLLFPAAYVEKKWVALSLIAYLFDWFFSFTMQIPIQFALQKGKNMQLLNDLLQTNWWRFTADSLQFIFVSILVVRILRMYSSKPFSNPQ